MRSVAGALTTLMALSVIVFAQYGTAPNNYYPYSFNGAIFHGTVTDTKDGQITLTFMKGSKQESFTGRFEKPCAVPSTDGRPMTAADIPNGTAMTVFFNKTSKKVDGKKLSENSVIAIAFEVWQGQKVNEDKKKIYWCTDDRQLQFRAFQ